MPPGVFWLRNANPVSVDERCSRPDKVDEGNQVKDNEDKKELSSVLREPKTQPTCPKFVLNTRNVNTVFIHWATSWKNNTKKLQVGKDILVVHHYRKPAPYAIAGHIEANFMDTSMQQQLVVFVLYSFQFQGRIFFSKESSESFAQEHFVTNRVEQSRFCAMDLTN
eukprot:s84_g24.t1